MQFDARAALFEASGVDLTRLPGIDTSTALKVISEVGTDLARFPSVKHFTSWLGLCPGTKISGGKVLCLAPPSRAPTAQHRPCAWRPRRCAKVNRRWAPITAGCARRMDRPKAITATAHKLARLVYFMLTKGQAYVEAGQQYYEERYRDRVVQNLTKRAHVLGFELTPATRTTP